MKKVKVLISHVEVFNSPKAQEGQKPRVAAIVLETAINNGTKAINLTSRQVARLAGRIDIPVVSNDSISLKELRLFSNRVGNSRTKAIIESEEKVVGSTYQYTDEKGEVSERKYGYDYTDPKHPKKRPEANNWFAATITGLELPASVQAQIDNRTADQIDLAWGAVESFDVKEEVFAEEAEPVTP